MLVAADGVTGLSTRINAVEMLRAIVQVETQCREMVVPVGILYDDLAFGIYGMGGAKHYVLRRILHQFQAVLRPVPIPFGSDAVLALAVMEEEIVQDDLVKKARRIFRNLPGLCPLDRIAVAVGLE